MIKAGVIGHPISHSLSPRIHNYWLKKYGIDGEYKAYDIPPAKLEDFIRTMPDQGFAGCNVTIPHKEKVFELMDELNIGSVHKIRAINTIIVSGRKLIGTNTDWYGFLENIRTYGHTLDKKNVLVLGAGGAARPICAGLQMLRCRITLINRTKDKAEKLAHDLGAGEIQVLPWEELEEAMKNKDVLVNTTSLGMVGQPPLNISLDKLPKHTLVTDIVYKPLITPLLAAAQARGNPTVDGLGMLLHQAAPGFKAWFGLPHLPEVTKELRDIILAP